MSENVIQTSFSSGELAPSIFARTDIAKYHSGAARMRNFFVDYRSGASTRTGTKFVAQVFDSTKSVRLIPFQYSIVSSYILEFGDLYIRFIANSGTVLETGFAITAASNVNPGTVTATGNNFVNGDWVFISGIVGAINFNSRFYKVTVAGAVLSLSDVNGVPINAFGYPAYVSGGTVSRVYKIASPYAAADLALLKFTQSASVLTLTHPNYAPRNLVRSGPTNWALQTISFATTILPPTGLVSSTSGSGSTNYSYVVTSVDGNGQESLPSAPLAVNNAVNIGATAGTINLTWNPAAGAIAYNVYKAELVTGAPVPAGVAYGFVSSPPGNNFNDSNIVPDFITSPPTAQNPFANANNPGVTAYFQQRQVYASSKTNPNTFWASQPGNFNNFNISDPIQADDAITGTLVSSQVNEIQSLVSMPGGLIAMTGKGAWQISGGGSNVGITPANATAVPQAFNGANEVPPIPINNDILYVQAKGSIVRFLSFNIYANIYTGSDISIFSNHLFSEHTVLEWGYAEEPYKIVWAVRDDGILLSLTYVKEQEIVGWAHHDTLGVFKSVAVITEGELGEADELYDAVYVIVQRYISGRWVQYIERFMEREAEYGPEDAWAVDAGVISASQGRVATLLVSTNTGPVTFIADNPVFTVADVGSIIRSGGGIATITTFVSQNEVLGNITKSIDAILPNSSNSIPLPQTNLANTDPNWTISTPFTTFIGLDHLEGQTVSILADGSVVTPQVVTNGSIILPQPASKVIVGLGFTAQLQTMYLDVQGGDTVQGKRKKINALSVRVANTRGLWAGRTFETLVPIKELSSLTPMNQPSPLVTGDERVIMDPLWDVPGQICIQITDPLPATILGVIPEITIGDTK